MKRFATISVLLIISVMMAPNVLCGAENDKNKIPAPRQSKVPTARNTVPNLPDPAVAEIRRQLEEIIQIHKTLQQVHQGQLREIQRITDQARAHQKLLNQLAPVRASNQVVKSSNLEEIIRMEKIRQIQVQAQQNRAALEELKAEREAEGQEGEVEAEGEREAASTPAVRPAPTPQKSKLKFW